MCKEVLVCCEGVGDILVCANMVEHFCFLLPFCFWHCMYVKNAESILIFRWGSDPPLKFATTAKN